MANKEQAVAPATLKEFVKMRSTVLQDKMREALEKREEAAHKQVLQTKVDRSQNYDIDGVSMDSGGVRVATEKPIAKKTNVR